MRSLATLSKVIRRESNKKKMEEDQLIAQENIRKEKDERERRKKEKDSTGKSKEGQRSEKLS